jgi:transposase
MVYKYHEIIKSCNEVMKRKVRLQVIHYSQENGIKPAARYFQCSKNTVKRLLFEYANGNKHLEERTRRPNHSPKRIEKYWELTIISESQKLIASNKRTDAAKLKRELNIKYSEKTIRKVLNDNGLFAVKRRKYQKKRDLREMKKKYKAFEKIQVDVKYLNDIVEFYDDYKRYNLPKFQFTARCIRTGAIFIAYGRELTTTNAVIFINYVLRHLKKHGIVVRIIQTDNGIEFIQNWQMKNKSEFTKAVETFVSEHRLIPPGAKTWQSDVESSHRLIEDELYAHQVFNSAADFFNKAKQYQSHFNTARKNSYKFGKTPNDILKEIAPEIKSKIMKLDPIILDNYLEKYYFKKAA